MIKDEFEAYLSEIFESDYPVKQAMNYSLLANSKRLRPLLLLSALKDIKGTYQEGFDCAAAIEMVHTYSLIHDDLPAFDDDDYRRGQLTCHKQFDEPTAILAGDGLLTAAFGQISNSDSYNDNQKVKLISLLSEYAGQEGMVKGQCLDMLYESKQVTIDQLEEMDGLKTGKLITLPLLAASVISDREELNEQFKDIGKKLGLAFQIQDDLLDVLSNKQMTGKSNSDEANEKSTYVSLLSVDIAKEKVDELFNDIYEKLDQMNIEFISLKELIKNTEKRKW